MTKKKIAVAMACAAIMLLGACTKSSTLAPAAPPPAAPDGAPAADGAVTITTTEYAFDIPAITAGSHALELNNEGAQVHMAAIVQLLDGKTVEDALAYIEANGTEGPAPSWAKEVAFGIAGPGTTAPMGAAAPDKEGGAPEQAAAPIDLAAGDYVALCFVPDGMTSMDGKPPKGAKTHAELGMVQGFSVA